MPKATRSLSEIRLSRLTNDPVLRRWFEGNEPDQAFATLDRPVQCQGGAAAELVIA